MQTKLLWRVSTTTSAEAEDAVANLLSEILDAPASSYHNIETNVSTVSVYLRRKPGSSREIRKQISIGLNRIRRYGLRIGSKKIAITKVQRRNWAQSWKRHFKPIEIGNTLLIKPSWSKRKPRKEQAVVVLDPGLSFGTGHHPTTSFCLREIVLSAGSHVRANSESENKNGIYIPTGTRGLSGPRSFLDLGTGSGILAIAAAKLGYSPVHALDCDPEAIRIARANAGKNRVRQKLKIQCGDVAKLQMCPGQQRQKYDLICANLVFELLLEERHRIAAQLKRSGMLVLAGILKKEFAQIRKAYQELGMKLVLSHGEKEWCSGSFGFGKKFL